MRSMTIGMAARKAEVGVETIRFYEREGLIERPPKPATFGFRTYPDEAIERIRFIRQAQELGFSLREVRELIGLRAAPKADAAEVRARALAKLDDVNRKIARLGRIRRALSALIAACPGRGALSCCSIMEELSLDARAGRSKRPAAKARTRRMPQ